MQQLAQEEEKEFLLLFSFKSGHLTFRELFNWRLERGADQILRLEAGVRRHGDVVQGAHVDVLVREHLEHAHHVGHDALAVGLGAVDVLGVEEAGHAELVLDGAEGELETGGGVLAHAGDLVEVERVGEEVVEDGGKGLAVLPAGGEVHDVDAVVVHGGLSAPGEKALLQILNVAHADHLVELPMQDDGPDKGEHNLGVAVHHVHVVDVDNLDLILPEHVEDDGDVAELVDPERALLPLDFPLGKDLKNGDEDDAVAEVVEEVGHPGLRDAGRGQLWIEPLAERLLLDILPVRVGRLRQVVHVGGVARRRIARQRHLGGGGLLAKICN